MKDIFMVRLDWSTTDADGACGSGQRRCGRSNRFLMISASDYRGVKCSAIFNTANFQYYADDVYGRKKE